MTAMSDAYVLDGSDEPRRNMIILVTPPTEADKQPIRVRVVRHCDPSDLRCALGRCGGCRGAWDLEEAWSV
jgi:hypothetical protein